ncbi:carbon monoxide dehydrogenase subunit G [Rhodococcus fascians]|uniref:SRPBCC family protein n=1 Tax=Nocardiaceae TaxID=85025 RepID=UPI00050C08B7|nr:MULTISPECIES: SRPBCC family protein [Rhodococcus]MDP9635772.1 carbon monoxide dehydrogenase subunit G [Rhodococcus cercidiphylli]RZL70107.1 MAG: polyketide cyclase [Rhodococcus sp. (in: high G+C Gram-positive bacteria)]MBY4012907.1 SRPBCC family protein [Rhodococcus fascians]MBY4020688.1 SRPBCC family protein [Rhodococcus fascians]MDQ0281666.1 carbon monoxide dehydrogenase subunit G [Rhodococcus fascians]
MVDVTRTFTAAVALDKAAAFLRDFSNASTWDPGTESCTQVSDGPVAVGTQWHNVSKLFGVTTELTYTLVTDEPDHVVLEGKNKTATSVDDITLTAEGPASTRIDYHAHVEFNGAAKVAGPFLKAGFEAKVAPETVKKMTAALERL